MMYYFGHYLWQGELWLTDQGFHISAEATSSQYIPVPPLMTPEMVPFATGVFAVLSSLYLFGYGRKILNWVFCALCIYIQAMDQPSSFSVNRLLISYFFLLSLQPPEEEVEGKRVMSGWLFRIIQLTLALQYFGAGICKGYFGDWLNDMNYVIWSQSQGHYKNLLSAWAIHEMPGFMWSFFAWGTLILETGAPFFLFYNKRTRLFCILGCFLMHLGIAVLMKDLIFFSFQMVTAYVFFLPEQWVLRPMEWLREKIPIFRY